MKVRLLGLDLGDSSLGIAVSDSLGIIHTRKTFFFPSKHFNQAMKEVDKLLKEEGFKTVIIGLPLLKDGVEGESALRSRKFQERLVPLYPDVKFILLDESFSTKEAYNIERINGHNAKKAKDNIDSVSAAVILERYLKDDRN